MPDNPYQSPRGGEPETRESYRFGLYLFVWCMFGVLVECCSFGGFSFHPLWRSDSWSTEEAHRLAVNKYYALAYGTMLQTGLLGVAGLCSWLAAKAFPGESVGRVTLAVLFLVSTIVVIAFMGKFLDRYG